MDAELVVQEFLVNYLNPHQAKVSSALKACFAVLSLPKQQILWREGQYSHKAYYLVEGAARSFYLKAEGLEVCTWFAFEGELLGNLQTYLGQAATETVQLLEPAKVIEINLPQLKAVAEEDLTASSLIIKLLEEYAAFLEERLQHLQFESSKARYQALLEREPGIFQRISLTNIATYLGISRETLSRLRAKKLD